MRTSWAAGALVSKARFMKGARSDASPLSSERLVSPYRGSNDRKVRVCLAELPAPLGARAPSVLEGRQSCYGEPLSACEHYLRVMRTASGSDE